MICNFDKLKLTFVLVFFHFHFPSTLQPVAVWQEIKTSTASGSLFSAGKININQISVTNVTRTSRHSKILFSRFHLNGHFGISSTDSKVRTILYNNTIKQHHRNILLTSNFHLSYLVSVFRPHIKNHN